MMTDNAFVRSIHAVNPLCFAPRASKTDKGQLNQLFALAGDLSMDETAHRLNISYTQVQADRNSAALQTADRYNAFKVLKNDSLLLVAADVDASSFECWHPVVANVGFEDVLNSSIPVLLA